MAASRDPEKRFGQLLNELSEDINKSYKHHQAGRWGAVADHCESAAKTLKAMAKLANKIAGSEGPN